MDGSKRILYVITKGHWGGAQRYVYDLAVAAKAQGHDVMVVYGEEGPLGERLQEAGISYQSLPFLTRDIHLKSELLSLKHLYDFIREYRPDVVHVNSSKAGLTLLASRVAMVKRVIFTAHGWAFNEARPRWQRSVMKFFYALMIYLAHTTICVSEAVHDDMSWVPFKGKSMKVIRLGITPPSYKSKEEARRVLAEDLASRTWIGAIAELHPTKRILDAIEAMADVVKKHPNAVLIILGEGQERAVLEERVKVLSLESSVRFCGFVKDAATYAPAFDIFVLPSRSEALGYVLLEAGGAGIATVATRVGGIPEIIDNKKTGLLVPPYNPAVFARALVQLLEDDELRASLGKALKERVDTEFSLSRMTERTFALYYTNS